MQIRVMEENINQIGSHCSFLIARAISDQQGRTHGQYQLWTGGQGRKCAFSHFSTRAHGRTDGRTDGRTKALIELRVRN